HYFHLQQQRFPSPRLYGVLRIADDEEILFLEYLEETGLREESVEDWRHYFSIMARFNATKITSDYAANLPRIGYDETSMRCWRAPADSDETILLRLSHDL